MPRLSVMDAIAATAGIGYAGIELAAMPGWPAAPDALDSSARRDVSEALRANNLALSGLMTALEALAPEDKVQQQTQYLREVARLGHDLDDTKTPVLIATIGGPVDGFAARQAELIDRIAAWCAVCAEEDAIFALEPHVGGIVHTPQQAEVVRKEVNSPALKYNFDMSHFVLRGIPVAECVALMGPHSVHTHVKDAAGDAEHITFLLPGEGDFDYPGYLREMMSIGYDGFITVEVSGMVWNAEGYDPLVAAQFSYDTLRTAFDEVGL